MPPTEVIRILVIEDDPGIAGSVVRGLRAAGLEVELATNGKEGARIALASPPDLLVLDLMLPETSGFAVLEQLRDRVSFPIIVLTARGGLEDRLRCFGLGAIDYVTKPFWMEELLARIRTRLGARATGPRRTTSFGSVEVDLDGRTLTVAGRPLELTRHEFDLLAYLVQRPGRAVSRSDLTAGVLAREPSSDGVPDARTVDSHIARIRKKLDADGACIRTVWGIGYRFEPPKGG